VGNLLVLLGAFAHLLILAHGPATHRPAPAADPENRA
jgi:hypothetical protein